MPIVIACIAFCCVVPIIICCCIPKQKRPCKWNEYIKIYLTQFWNNPSFFQVQGGILFSNSNYPTNTNGAGTVSIITLPFNPGFYPDGVTNPNAYAPPSYADVTKPVSAQTQHEQINLSPFITPPSYTSNEDTTVTLEMDPVPSPPTYQATSNRSTTQNKSWIVLWRFELIWKFSLVVV